MQNVAQNSSSAGVEKSSLSREQLLSLGTDPELRRLAPGSAEYQAALNKKFGKTTGESPPPASETKDGPEKTDAASKDNANDKTDENEGRRWSPSARARVDELYGEVKNRDRELEALRAENEALKKGGGKQDAAPVPVQGAKYDKPKPSYDDYVGQNPKKQGGLPQFNEDLLDWKADKRDFEKEQRETAKRVEDEGKKRLERFVTQGKDVEKELDLTPGDFDSVMQSKEAMVFKPGAAEALHESDFGARIAYEIVTKDGVRKEFAAMSPTQQVKFIGKLERQFEDQKKSRETNTRTASGAKPPGKDLQRGSATSVTNGSVFQPKMRYADYEAKRNEQLRAQGKNPRLV